MRAHWLSSVAIFGIILGSGGVMAQDNGVDTLARQHRPSAAEGGAAKPAEMPAKRAAEPNAPSSQTAPGTHVQSQSGVVPKAGQGKIREGQTGNDQKAVEPRQTGEESQRRREPNAGEAAESSQSIDRGNARQNSRTDRKNPSQSAEENKADTTHRTLERDQTNRRVQNRGEESGQPGGQRNTMGNSNDQMRSNGGERTRAEPNDETGALGAGRIDAQQQSRIRETIRRAHVEPERDVNFSLKIGEAVPERVHFRPLPPELISIVPQYRGYDYVVVEDQIIIVDPRTRRVVYVIDEGQAQNSDRPRFYLSSEQRRSIRSEIVRRYQGDRNGDFAIRIGERVPEDIELVPLPRDVYGEVPNMEPFQYFVMGDQVVIVDPDTREIVDIID
jgi:hypothetical protein